MKGDDEHRDEDDRGRDGERPESGYLPRSNVVRMERDHLRRAPIPAPVAKVLVKARANVVVIVHGSLTRIASGMPTHGSCQRVPIAARARREPQLLLVALQAAQFLPIRDGGSRPFPLQL